MEGSRAELRVIALIALVSTVVGERGQGSTGVPFSRSVRLRDTGNRPAIDAGIFGPACAVFVKKVLGAALGFALLGFDRGALGAQTEEGSTGETSRVADQLLVKDRERERLWKPPAIRIEVARFFSNSEFPDISRTAQEIEAERLAKIKDAERAQRVAADNNALKHRLQPGDHIRSKGAFGFSSLAHHAIYIGNGEIVHFTGGAGEDTSLAAKRRAAITREGLDVILDIANAHATELEIVPRAAEASERRTIVARALSRVGEKGYNVVRSNCEHFAQWCITGETVSFQVKRALAAPICFLETILEDVLAKARHPVKGKPLRTAAATLYTALSLCSAHLLLFSW